MSLQTVLQVRGLAKHFGGVRALDGVDFDVPAGQCVALIGPNGAGKSTCFACLAGQQVPTAGEVLWQGQSLLGKPPAERQRLGVQLAQLPGQTFDGLQGQLDFLVDQHPTGHILQHQLIQRFFGLQLITRVKRLKPIHCGVLRIFRRRQTAGALGSNWPNGFLRST